MRQLLDEIKACSVCEAHLPLGPRPVMAASVKSKIAIIGQAPGKRVHLSGVPWDDPSGDNLRAWLGVGKDAFYNPDNFAIIPMGFCYPGTGKSGDLPPRPECAPLWHPRLLEKLTQIKLTLVIGTYAQKHYLGKSAQKNLTETVKYYAEYLPKNLPLPHPSPRNNIWMKKNPWFGQDVLPMLRDKVVGILGQ